MEHIVGEPEPDAATGRYSGPELGAWRAAVGVTSQEVADSLDVRRPYIARLERDATVSGKAGEKIIRAVRRRVMYRARMIAVGRSNLDAIRREAGR